MNRLELIEKLPKTELHLHIEGSLEPELMHRLAKEQGQKLKFDTVEEIRSSYEFDNLQSFLDIYYEGASVLVDENSFFELTWAYLERACADNVVHAEIFFDPQTHTERGIAFADVINGITRALRKGQKELGISSHLIMCFLRHLSEESAFETLKQAKEFLPLIKGVGLDSSEKGHPPSKFERVFKECRDLGLEIVAHAGEEGPAEYIWEALNLLKVSRIDHGVRAIEDEELLKLLAEKRIPLTVCPLSNVKLCVFKDLKDHNLKKMLELGLCVTINSDDPAYFGGYINQNFIETAEALDLSELEIKTLAKNSFEAAYMPKDLKEKYYLEIDQL